MKTYLALSILILVTAYNSFYAPARECVDDDWLCELEAKQMENV